ncbi:MAG TPA: T9SS type A sorting domain-containing protein [Bacteroidales bacterium]|nr:T9SS type A sorting domain-containing protein [Bacteroidales bacterium]
MNKLRLAAIFILVTQALAAQKPVGSWADHLSFNSARNVAVTPSQVYSSTGSALLVYDRRTGELSKLTKVQGLSETGISSIAWSAEQNSLVVAYSSTNIDIIKGKTITNIPDIKLKYIPGDKQIFRIRTRGIYAYLACSFGVVVLNIPKGEIYDTWKPGNENGTPGVYDVAFTSDKIYAATAAGVYYAGINDSGLSYFGNWTMVPSFPVPEGIYNGIVSSQDRIFVNHKTPYNLTDSVFVIDGGVSLFFSQQGIPVLSLEPATGGFTLTTKFAARLFSASGSLLTLIDSYHPGVPDISQAIADGNDIWIADNSSGLVFGQNMSAFSKYTLPGPYTNNVAYLTSSGGKTFISGGSLDNSWNNTWQYFQLFTNEGNNWHSELLYDLHDPMRILPDPADNGHYWVSTWGHGLIEFKDDSVYQKYDDSNSPLKTIIPGLPYSRVCGLALDHDGNIWMTQTGMPGTIKVLRPNKTWITNPVTIDVPTVGDIVIARNGYKWVVLPRGYGLFVLDDNKTPENFTDDRYKQFLIKDNDNHIISTVYCITEDLDGNIWLGTDQGPVGYLNPDRIFDDDPRAFRAKIPRNDGTGLADYMLGTEIITSIAVDGGNRKWLGTFSSGAYLLSADGTTKLANYNESNSPILSNTVVSLSVDSKSGEVWFGTANGVISVRGTSTSGSDAFRNVYSFPNPVRETFQGNVTITGLMRNTKIKITDVSGDLVYSTVSDGGEATWDLTTYNGRRVSTGVYLVFCASEDGSQSCVIKMLVIK